MSVHLRKSTLALREIIQERPVIHTGRRILPIDVAATRLQYPHTCKHDQDMATDKAQRRITALFIRFAFVGLLGCEASREPTHLQTGRSHCGNCECAHWSTSSTMRDDQMPRVLKDISNTEVLSPTKITYIRNRLGLDTPETKKFVTLPSKKARVEFVEKQVKPSDMFHSLHGTAYEVQLSSTLEGPIAANDFDQSIEKKFRPIEEVISQEVSEGKLDYKEATQKAFDVLHSMTVLSVTNLQTRIKQIDHYLSVEAKLDALESRYLEKNELTKDEVKDYTALVGELLQTRTQILIKLPFCANFKPISFGEKIAQRNDFFFLKSFASSQSQLHDDHLKMINFEQHMQTIKKGLDASPRSGRESVFIRLLEAQGQLAGMNDIGPCQLNQLDALLFGIHDPATHKRRAPTLQELKSQIVGLTKKRIKPDL